MSPAGHTLTLGKVHRLPSPSAVDRGDGNRLFLLSPSAVDGEEPGVRSGTARAAKGQGEAASKKKLDPDHRPATASRSHRFARSENRPEHLKMFESTPR